MKQQHTWLFRVVFALTLFFLPTTSVRATGFNSLKNLNQVKQLRSVKIRQVRRAGRLDKFDFKQLRQAAPTLRYNARTMTKQLKNARLLKKTDRQTQLKAQMCQRVRTHLQNGLGQYKSHGQRLTKRDQLVAAYLGRVVIKIETLGIDTSHLRRKLHIWEEMNHKLKDHIDNLLPSLENLAQVDCADPAAATEKARSMREKIRSVRQEAQAFRQYYFVEIKPELQNIRRQLSSLKQRGQRKSVLK